MNSDIWNIAAAIIFSLGGGAFIVFALSSWLGKIWANRIMEADRARHAQELEALRAKLQHENEQSISNLKTELEIFRDKHLKSHHDKVEIYRVVVNIIADLLADLDMIVRTKQPIPAATFDNFNRNRMKAYGCLAMLAPQLVMDAYDRLIDYLLIIINGKKPYEWDKVRNLAIDLINQVRIDIGLDKTPIVYKGDL